LAADILGVGVSRVKISPEAVDRLDEVVTKDDVRALINEGLIWAEPEKGVSRGRWRVRHMKKKQAQVDKGTCEVTWRGGPDTRFRLGGGGRG